MLQNFVTGFATNLIAQKGACYVISFVNNRICHFRENLRRSNMPFIDLTPDELLKTTRSVRKRLDLTKTVPMTIIEECMDLALQAPTSTYGENWRFMVVTDPDKKRAVAKWYKKGHELFVIAAPGPHLSRPRGRAVRCALCSAPRPPHGAPCWRGVTLHKQLAARSGRRRTPRRGARRGPLRRTPRGTR